MFLSYRQRISQCNSIRYATSCGLLALEYMNLRDKAESPEKKRLEEERIGNLTPNFEEVCEYFIKGKPMGGLSDPESIFGNLLNVDDLRKGYERVHKGFEEANNNPKKREETKKELEKLLFEMGIAAERLLQAL